MLVFLSSIILATAGGVVFFLYLVSGDFEKFRERFTNDNPTRTRNPHALPDPAKIALQLDVLKFKLERKQSDLESSKSRVLVAAGSLQKLTNTSMEVKKYYLKLKEDIVKSEEDCRELQQQIEEFKRKQEAVNEECQNLDKFGESVMKEVNYDLSKESSRNTLFSEISCNSGHLNYDFTI